MSLIPYIQHNELMVGRGHSSLADTLNRALRQVLTDSGLDPDASFPGFVLHNTNVYSVKSFSAVGDGTTNDLNAINTAIDTIPEGATLYFPPGTYAVNDVILIDKSVNFLGCGRASTIKQVSTQAKNTLNITANYVDVCNLVIRGNGVVGASNVSNVILIDSGNDITIRSNWIENGSLTGIQLDGTISRTRILFNTITSTNTNAGQTNSSDIYFNGGVIEDCDVIGNSCISTLKNNGILLQTGNGSAADRQRRNRISENNIHKAIGIGAGGGHGIALYVSVNSTYIEDTQITNNIVRDCDNMGIYVKGIITTPDLIVGTIVSNNRVVNTVTVGTGGTLLDGAIGIEDALGTIVSGNTIRQGGVATASAIRLGEGADDTVVVGNTIRSWTRSGIYLKGTQEPVRCVVVGNTIHTPNQGIRINGSDHIIANNSVFDATDGGIRLEANSVDCIASNNQVRDCGGVGLNILSGSVQSWIDGNILMDNTPNLQDAGTDTIVDRDNMSSDRGDNSVTLTVRSDVPTQLFNTTLTANRTVTLSTTGAVLGNRFKIVRKGLGAFTLDVGGLKTIPNSTAAVVEVFYNGSAWVLVGYQLL